MEVETEDMCLQAMECLGSLEFNRRWVRGGPGQAPPISQPASPLFCRGSQDQGVGRAVFSCVPMRSSLCVLKSFSYKNPRPLGLGPPLVTSFYCNYPFKDPVSKHSHIFRH